MDQILNQMDAGLRLGVNKPMRLPLLPAVNLYITYLYFRRMYIGQLWMLLAQVMIHIRLTLPW